MDNAIPFQPVNPSSELASNPENEAKSFLATDTGSGSGGIKKIIFLFLGLFFLILIGFAVYKLVLPKLGGVVEKEITLTYWGLWEPEEIMNPIIADYQKNHPKVKINYVYSSIKEYRERLVSNLTNQQGPDIFRFHNTWVPMLKNDLASIPSSVMDNNTFEANYYPVMRSDLKYGNNYVGLPLMFEGLALYVNEDLFQSGGKTYPKTWDEVKQAAKDLCVSEAPDAKCTPGAKIITAGISLGRTENVDHWSDILGLMLFQNDADPARPNLCKTEAGKESCNGYDVLAYYTFFVSGDHVWDETLPSSTQAFAGGKVAMYFGPSWEAIEIKKINPNLKFSVLPVPQVSEKTVTWASYWAEGVSKKSANQEAAWEFLKYLSSKETLEKLFLAQSRLSPARPFGEPYPRTEMASLLKGDKYLGAFVDQAPTAKSWYLSSRTFDNGLNDQIIKYYEAAIVGLNAGKGQSEVMETLSSGVAQVLGKYGLSSQVVK